MCVLVPVMNSTESKTTKLVNKGLIEFHDYDHRVWSAVELRDWLTDIIAAYGDVRVSCMLPLGRDGEWVGLPIHGTWEFDALVGPHRATSQIARDREPDIGVVCVFPLHEVVGSADRVHGERLIEQDESRAN